MFQSMKTYLALALIGLSVGACMPAEAAIATSSGTAPTPVVSMLKPMSVADVHIDIGVGSPMPVDAFISGELPDTCAQLAEMKVEQTQFEFQISVLTTASEKADCLRDTLPFRMSVPLNMVNQSEGMYTVKVNGASTTFKWPSEPTITPEPIGAPSVLQTYRSTAYGIEVDYPAGWILESSGDGAILWSKQPVKVGVGGVPADVAKIDIGGELGSTVTLDELVARQKQGVAEVNGKILSEEALTLASGLRAIRMSVSAMGDNVTLLTIVNGHPVVLTGYGDLGRFDEVARTLRPIQP
ncbi:MAG: hypothetical protein U0559_13600 [Anaerolineae bacterium]